MNIKIVDLSEVPFEALVSFYGAYGDATNQWYHKKFYLPYKNGLLLGKICIDESNGNLLGAYLGVDQRLLCNLNLKAVQCIDTLIAPSARGGGVLRKLAFSFYSDLEKMGYQCVYGLPNKLIEPIRYKVLGWNKSRDTYRFIVPVPVPFLALMHYFFCIKDKLFGRDIPIINLDENIVKFCDGKAKDKSHNLDGMFWISYKAGIFEKVGIVRGVRNLGFVQKFKKLCLLASKAKGLFLQTYATCDSETAELFNSFSLKSARLHFAGRIILNNSSFSFGENSFEYLEFDTYGVL